MSTILHTFSVCFPVRSHFASLQGIYYFLLLLSNDSMSKTLQTTLYFNTTSLSLFGPHINALVLLIVTSFRISSIIDGDKLFHTCNLNYEPWNISERRNMGPHLSMMYLWRFLTNFATPRVKFAPLKMASENSEVGVLLVTNRTLHNVPCFLMVDLDPDSGCRTRNRAGTR